MLLVSVISSNLMAMGYDPATGELQIQFRNGRIYSYQSVPPEIYDGLINAPSKGTYFGYYVRRIYPYVRIL